MKRGFLKYFKYNQRLCIGLCSHFNEDNSSVHFTQQPLPKFYSITAPYATCTGGRAPSIGHQQKPIEIPEAACRSARVDVIADVADVTDALLSANTMEHIIPDV